MMKNKVRFTLLFALVIALLLGTLALIPFSAFADDYTLIVHVVDRNGTSIGQGKYGTIEMENGGSKDTSNPSYTYPAGTVITLTACPNENYDFYGWMDQVSSSYKLASGDTLIVTLNSNTVIVYAVFKPHEYNVHYVSQTSDPIGKYGTDTEYHPDYLVPTTPDKHTYGTATELPTQVYTRVPTEPQTHTFDGWKAYDPDGNEIPLENGSTLGANVKSDVYLVPQWIPEACEAKRIDRAGTPDKYTELGEYTETVNYGALISGKDFGGVKEYVGYWFDESNPDLYTEVSANIGTTAVVYRYYTPCEYRVIFDINAPTNAVVDRGIEEMTVVFDEPLPAQIAVPSCTGWEFLGYYYISQSGVSKTLYYDAEGNLGAISKWVLTKDATLVAQWKLQEHNVIVHVVDRDGNECNDAVEILVNGDPNPGVIEYGTTGTITITVLSGQNKKLTKWGGTDIAHVRSYTGSFTMEESDFEITVQLLPAMATPETVVDYEQESLLALKVGTYQVTANGVTQEITVGANGALTLLPLSDLFGKEIRIVHRGTADWSADSDEKVLVLAARPAQVTGEELKPVVCETKRERSISIPVENGANGVYYEMAYTTAEGEAPENWSSNLRIENLEIGTFYTVYLRVRASATAPHGETTMVLENYEFSHLVDLKPLFIILLCLLALQILALVFLMISRRRARMNAVAAPLLALLAVKTIPAGLFPWIIVLTIAVVVLQIVLVVISLQTGVLWQKRTKEEEPKEEADKRSDTPSSEFTLFGEETKQPLQAPEDENEQDQDQNN